MTRRWSARPTRPRWKSSPSSRHGKHALVEKPLHADSEAELTELERLARGTGAVCYTAYNHRFEPHYVRMRDLIASGALGSIYRCRMFYGNGTARLVRNSEWRDQGAGVLPDLGSHLLDTARFLVRRYRRRFSPGLGQPVREPRARSCGDRLARRIAAAGIGDDAAVLGAIISPATCSRKTAPPISNRCANGGRPPSPIARRVLPSGRPPEAAVTLVQDDPTWALEYDHFKQLVAAKTPTDLANDRWLSPRAGPLSDRREFARTGDDDPTSAMRA